MTYKPKTREWAINPGNDCELYDPRTKVVIARFEHPEDARLACAAPRLLIGCNAAKKWLFANFPEHAGPEQKGAELAVCDAIAAAEPKP